MLPTFSKHFRYTSPLAAVAAILAGAACGDSGGSTGGTGGGNVTTTTSSSSSSSTSASSSSGTGGSCDGFGDGTVCPANGTVQPFAGAAMAIDSVTAHIVDETGQPAGGVTVFICGTDICSNPGKTGPDGSVTLVNNTSAMKNPAFKFGNSLTEAEIAIPLTTATTDFTPIGTGKLATAKLPAAGVPLTPGTDATSGDVTLSVPAGGSVSFDILHATCESQVFRAVNVPLTNLGPVLDPVTVNGTPADFKLFYGVAPAQTAICPAARVTVALPHKIKTPNDLDWVAGAAVEFWIMTTDSGQQFAPYGGWAKMSDGTVSADGTTVSTNDGANQGFVALENFAIRLK